MGEQRPARRWRRTLNAGLAAAALGEPHLLPPQVRRSEAADLARFAGRYETSGGGALEVGAFEGHLYVGKNELGVPDDVAFFVESSAPGRFAGIRTTENRVVTLEFESDASGRVVGLAAPAKDGSVRAVRTYAAGGPK